MDPPLPLYELDLTGPGALQKLLGMDLDIIALRPGLSAKVLGWPGAEDRLRAAGATYRLLTDDYGRDVARQRSSLLEPSPRRQAGTTSTTTVWNVPPLGQGSFGGFWTLEEVYALLDSLASTDTQGIVGALDTIGVSCQGRPILALTVTDFSRPLGTRPAVLYDGLIHAREPMAMQVVLHFLLRVLEGYGTDPELTYLVNEREMCFVPVLNPDGYVRNYNTWAGTGSFGMWRKNLRDNDGHPNTTNKDGVDLNRNYAYAWGYDDSGSSPNISNEIYRGTGPFSEPETQAIRDLCLARHFRTAETYHSFGELCLYPWTYIPSTNADSVQFIRLADAMLEDTDYPYGGGPQLLYAANGVAIDWYYGEQSTKPKIFGLSTEVGSLDDGFWPPVARILPLADINLRANKILAYGAGVFLTADSLWMDPANPFPALGAVSAMRIHLRHDGVADATTGGIRVTVHSGLPQVSIPKSELRFSALAPGEGAWPLDGDSFLLASAPNTVPGTRVPLYLDINDDGAYVGRDTVSVRVGVPDVLFADGAGSGLGNWTVTGTWGIESMGGNPFFSDSPGSDYGTRVDMSLTLNQGLNLTGAVNAALQFRTWWQIEAEMDFGRVEVSADGGTTWVALPGPRTRLGHGSTGNYVYGTQPLGVPGYAGTQLFWVDEEIDLAPYLGNANLRLRFRLTSDVGTEGNGWWIDDIRVLAYGAATPTAVADEGNSPRWIGLAAIPNPSRGSTALRFTLDETSPVRLLIYDPAGREVKAMAVESMGPGEVRLDWNGRDSQGRLVPPGIYFARVETRSRSGTTKLLVVR